MLKCPYCGSTDIFVDLIMGNCICDECEKGFEREYDDFEED